MTPWAVLMYVGAGVSLTLTVVGLVIASRRRARYVDRLASNYGLERRRGESTRQLRERMLETIASRNVITMHGRAKR